jgi:hypothetical protein
LEKRRNKAMGTQQELKLTGRLNSSIEVSKFTVLSPSTGTYPDGVDAPSGANAVIAGVADESIIPEGYSDYSGGTYPIATGTAWPAAATPSASTGRAIGMVRRGIIRVKANAAISAFDRVNIADVYGRIKTINEVAGTIVHELGTALEAATAQNDVIRVDCNPIDRHA